MKLTQADWIPGSLTRQRLFAHVVAELNREAGKVEFEALDGSLGPFIRHIPTEAILAVRPSLPANAEKPFDVWVRLNHRFPVTAAGAFNASLCVQRTREIGKLKLPDVRMI